MTDPKDAELGVEKSDLDELTLPQIPRNTPTNPAPVDPPVTASQVIEIIEDRLAPLKLQVSELHSILMPVKLPDGSKKGGLGDAVHEMNQHLTVIRCATDGTPEKLDVLPRLIAEAVATKILALYESELRSLHTADNAMLQRITDLDCRVSELEPPTAPNGGSHSGDSDL